MSVAVKVPSLGESVSEATIAKWRKKVGDTVAQDETIAELETDKVTLEVNASAAGVLLEIIAPEGSSVGVGAVIGQIGAAGSAPAPVAPTPVAPAPIAAVAAAAAPAAAKAAQPGPAARKALAEAGLSADAISGSGTAGRVTKADVAAAVAAPAAAPSSSPTAAPDMPRPAQARPVQAREERVKMSRLRQRIAQRLKEAQNTAAMLTTFNEIDMSAVIGLRNTYRDQFEKRHGVKLGFMGFFTRAVIAALKEFPAVNAEISGDEIIYKNYYHIGVAVSTPTGLVVPVLRDADQLSLAEIEKTIGALGVKARDGKLAMDELAGGTFTITNGGVFGSLMSTPILNPPQSGILGMHKTQERPIAVNGKVEIRPMMYVALSYDHRIIDGREAVSFLVRVKDALEDPQRLLLDV